MSRFVEYFHKAKTRNLSTQQITTCFCISVRFSFLNYLSLLLFGFSDFNIVKIRPALMPLNKLENNTQNAVIWRTWPCEARGLKSLRLESFKWLRDAIRYRRTPELFIVHRNLQSEKPFHFEMSTV